MNLILCNSPIEGKEEEERDEIIILNDFVQKKWLTVVAKGILWWQQHPRTNSTGQHGLAVGDGVK